MKRAIYIISFTILGVLLQLLIHGFIETWYINLLVQDYQTYGLGLSWSDWYLVHDVISITLAIAGLAFGFFSGRYWWKQIYVLHRWKQWKK
ncbi:MAG: hypothetical protein Q8R08_01535 [bacterium]|nr:hypothetical protein [bacterium]